MAVPTRPVRRVFLAALLSTAGLAAGCGGGEDGVRSYKVPKTTEAGAKSPHGAGDQTPAPAGEVRMLGAIIPLGDGQNYFVRMLDKADRVAAVEKEFDAFLNSIRVPGEGGKPISWTAPPGAKEGSPRPVRVVTYTLGPPGATVDVYISDPLGGTVLDNVNRWRTDFVGLPPTTAADLPTVAKEIQLGGTKAYRVDLRGPGGKGGKGGPFMKGGQ